MGRIFVVEQEGRSYRCKFCRTHLALADDLISQAFHCRRGKAYLFNNANLHTRRVRSIKKGSLFLKGRIVDDVAFSTEFYIDSRASMSDAEDV